MDFYATYRKREILGLLYSRFFYSDDGILFIKSDDVSLIFLGDSSRFDEVEFFCEEKFSNGIIRKSSGNFLWISENFLLSVIHKITNDTYDIEIYKNYFDQSQRIEILDVTTPQQKVSLYSS